METILITDPICKVRAMNSCDEHIKSIFTKSNSRHEFQFEDYENKQNGQMKWEGGRSWMLEGNAEETNALASVGWRRSAGHYQH